MRKLRDWLVLIIIIGGAIVGGTKYALWHYTNQMAKNIQSALPPGVFSYNGISTSLEGKSSIDNIVISTSGEYVYIKKLEVESSNIFNFFILMVKTWNDKLPSELSVNFKEIEIDGSSYFNDDENDSITSLGCKLTKADYLSMGYERVIIDAKLGYKVTPDDNLTFDYYFDIKNVTTVSGKFFGHFSTIDPSSGRKMQSQTMPSFDIKISNNKFLKDLYSLCAEKAKIPLDTYLEQLTLAQTKDAVDLATTMSFGLILDEQTIIGLNQYDKKPESLIFSLSPTTTLSGQQLKNMEPEAVIRALQPKLVINGKNIPIMFRWMSTEEMIEAKKPKPEYRAPVIQSDERILTPLNELNKKAFNKKIEVRLSSGRIYKGIFSKVEGNLLHMLILNRAGTSDLTIDTNTIKFVYILSDF